MPRKLSILALAIVVLHIVEVVTLGKSYAGSLLGNSLQIISSFVALGMCIGASRRGSGFSRSFWLLVGAGIGIWGVANVGWTYYEVVLHREPPELSFVRFLFDTQEAFFAIVLFLDQDQEFTELDLGFVLDAVQIGLVFLFIFVGLYYIPSLTLDTHAALVREYTIATAEVTALFFLALLRMFLTPSKESRKLYGGLAAYLAVYAVCSGLANYAQALKETPKGTLLDLAWTPPLLWGAFWAATWKPGKELQPGAALRTKTLGETILTNALFGVAPVLIFLLSTDLGPSWSRLRYSLLALSVLCYVARMAISDYRQSRNAELVRQQARALDSAVDGMAIVNAEGKYTYVNAGYAQMLGNTSREVMIGRPVVRRRECSAGARRERPDRTGGHGVARGWVGAVEPRLDGTPEDGTRAHRGRNQVSNDCGTSSGDQLHRRTRSERTLVLRQSSD
jgi:PAS domain-containing protein